ncbi:protein phosphatase 2C 51-like [Salvia miltiorrhiza]|uniref:protein phosphatase 2C 51-like n=1 Tax=Salvia miltiorrhiza TaxID=226208 RepID=UPI0025ACBCEF|nr:protein phosphatase 2C 51-like [Salvia miltiorrhiza]
MIFDELRQGSMAPEDTCRSEFKSGEVVLDSGDPKKSKNFGRKKMELRRIKSVSTGKSGDLVEFLDCKVSSRKRRSDVKKEIKLMEEALLVESDVGLGGSRDAACPAHGAVSIIGRRREMEDAVAAELDFLKKGGKSYSFFGVYDGHGGFHVARACSEMMHKLLVEIVEEDVGEEIAWDRVMAVGFRKMDEEVNKSGALVASTGSTAVVAVVGEEEVVVANCGDSRAVLSRGGVAVQLSDDHKPDRADELERIEGCGGKVINWNGHRVLGVLATSRSIGDEYLKPFVITDPEVKIVGRTKRDEFLILASDGLWDVISNEVACQVVRRCLRRSRSASAEAAAVLVELAMARGSYDNISVLIVDLT